MKLNLALLKLLLLNAVLVIIPSSEASPSNSLPPQFVHTCRQYEPNTTNSCGSDLCPPGVVNYQATSGFDSGEGIFSLEHATVGCTSGQNTESSPCVTNITDIVRRQDDSGYCCDRDNDGSVGAHPGCPAAADCQDDNPWVNPNQAEICGDGIDNDCYGGDAQCCIEWGQLCSFGGNCCGDMVCGCSNLCLEPTQCIPNCTGEHTCFEGCCGVTPVVVDVFGNGIRLTNAQGGVEFDLNADGSTHQIAWTSSNSDDAWLALDRNGNGRIDDGREMFGDAALQPPSAQPNGFLALAEFDKSQNGGNNDGIINKKDAVFLSLRLWQDRNHNGVSEPTELNSLKGLGLKSIDLDYKTSERTDQYGNKFRYRSKVRDTHDAQLGRWAWDVFLVQ